jgi:hypothetical protein
MTILKSQTPIRFALGTALFLLVTWNLPVLASEPIQVSHSVSIRNGDWIPLPIEDMRRAAGDAALSRLTDAGRLQLNDAGDSDAAADNANLGSLALEIALIGPAETAKLTIRLNVPGSPTLVTTASISVRALDHAGIYAALEHVGVRAADRLVAKLDLLQNQNLVARLEPDIESNDPARRKLYDEAQSLKRSARYAEARSSFESIVASADDPRDTLRQLAEDELRYGLPVFEAQQSLNSLGRMSMPGQQGNLEEALSRAENLYRQIQAENPSNVARVTQAQQALDNLIVTRSALANALRANTISQVYGLRMAMMEFMMMEGECPDRARIGELIEQMRARVTLKSIQSEANGARLYHFEGNKSPGQVALRCHDFEIEIVDSQLGRHPSPASFR